MIILSDQRANKRKKIPLWLRHRGEFLTARILVCLLQMIPLEWCERLSRKLGWLACDVLKIRKSTTDENLAHVFADKTPAERQQIAREMWNHLFLMICEIAQAPRKIHDTNWRDYVYIRDKQLMTGYFLAWRPVVMVSGHLGNFELAVFITGILGIPTYAIARPLDNPLLNRWIHQFRESRGQFILPTHGSAAEIQKVLDSGGMLSLLGDQHAGTKGCWVDFMGRPASCHKAVALFTLSGDAPMLVSYTVRRAGPLQMEVGCNAIADPADLDPGLRDVRSLTQWYNRELETLIRQWPWQYWWMHRRWKEKPKRRSRTGQSEPRPKPGKRAA